MSGVFGIADPQQHLDVRRLADRMAAAMSHRAWFVADRVADETRRVALGRIGIGIFNQAPQPAWNADRTIALTMAGEFYNRDAPGIADPTLADEHIALDLYQRAGDDFARQLNGAFVIAVWDVARRRVVIANDRFGLYPTYFTTRAGRLIFAPEVKGILCDNTFERKLDLTALAQYMRFQHLLGERTFFEDIQLLPCASVLTYDLSSATHRVKPYWTLDDIPYRPNIRFGEAVEETGRLLRRAVRRLSGDAYRPGVYLSGGLDSRTIVGMTDRRPIVSLTYGERNCRDVHIARRIARAVGSDHHWLELPNGHWVEEYADFHVALTEGFHSWIHAHGITTLAQARQLIDVNLTGWDGGTVMGHSDSIEPLQMHAVDDIALTQRMLYLFNQEYTWPSLLEGEENLLYAEPIRPQMRGLAFDAFREEMAPYLHCRPDVRGEYFYVRNHCRRLTQNMITFARSHIEVRFPFVDYDLFDFLYSLPALVRGHRALYLALIQRETPRLAYIPYDHDEFLPTTKPIREAHAALVKLKRRVNRRWGRLFPERATLYADYEGYLRDDLRVWAEGILYDRRTIERGLFDPAYVRTLMQRHLSGQEQWTIGKIAPLITYEMMLRALHDGETP